MARNESEPRYLGCYADKVRNAGCGVGGRGLCFDSYEIHWLNNVPGGLGVLECCGVIGIRRSNNPAEWRCIEWEGAVDDGGQPHAPG